MNPLDGLLLAVGAFFVIRGLFRGLSGVLFSLIGLIGSMYCSFRFYPPLSAGITRFFGISPLFASAVAMFAIFFGIFFICALLERGLKRMIRFTNLTVTDKIAGGLAGFFITYSLALFLFVVGVLLSPFTGDAWVRDSKALSVVAQTWYVAYPALDRIGILPNLAELQEEAKRRLEEEAARSLREANRSPASGDLFPRTAPPAATSADAVPSVPPQTDYRTTEGERPAGEGQSLLDLFLRWGK